MPAATITEVFEVHVDLWGLSDNWMESIYDKISSEVYQSGECLEMNRCPANMSILYRTDNRERAEKAKSIANRLYALGLGKTDPKNVYYELRHG